MFGRFNTTGRGRQSRGRGQGLGNGRGHGRGRNRGRGFRSNRAGFCRGGMMPGHPEERRDSAPDRQEARPANIPGGNAVEEFCPLCENHCPLSAPSCKQGRAYAASLDK